MKVLAIIPARGGSKTIPKKNIKVLGGEPLIGYSIRSALESKLITTIMVSTDDVEIALIAEEYGNFIPFMRSNELALDHTPTVEVVVDILNIYKSKGIVYDAVILLEPTYPFRRKGEIDDCINKFKNSGADSLISVIEVPSQFNPHWVFETNQEDSLEKSIPGKLIGRRQVLPKAYARDGSIYITKTSTLLNQGCLYGNRIAYSVNTSDKAVNIDSMDDWFRAEQLISKYLVS